MNKEPSKEPDVDLKSPERRREIEQETGFEPGELRKAIKEFSERYKPPRIEVPPLHMPDIPDIGDSIVRAKQADRDALSSIIERHTKPVREAVNALLAAHETASVRMFWLTVAIVVLTILLVVFGGISTYLLLR